MADFPRDITRRCLLALTAVVAGNRIYPVYGLETTPGDQPRYTKDNYVYKAVGSLPIKADVYRYPGTQAQPVILWIHGGALITASRRLLPPALQMERYLEAGFTIVSIDYRLAPETKLPAIVEDMEDAYAWIRAEGPHLFNGDPNRIAVMGMSAGAYLTQLAGVRLKPRPKALVSFYGYGDITGTWLSQPNPSFNQSPAISRQHALEAVSGPAISESSGSSESGRGDFNVFCRQHGLWPKAVSGHDPHKELAWFSDYEPRRHITPDYPPTLLLHGEKDADVPFEQSVMTAQSLRDHRVDHEFISNPLWGHAFDYAKGDPAIQRAFDGVLSFLEKYLRR